MKPTTILACVALLLPGTALAEFSYSWFEIGYVADVEQETGAGDDSGDGFDFRINFLAGDLFFITGHVEEITLDDSDLDIDRFGLGLGIRHMLGDNLGIFGTLTYEDFESELGDTNGIGGAIGLRYQMQQDFEAFGGVKHASYDKGEGTFINIGGVWAFSQNFALVAEYTTGKFELDELGQELDRDDVRIALRAQF